MSAGDDGVPDFQTLMRPVLEFGLNGTVPSRDTVDALSDQFGLTPEQRALMLPSGRQPIITNRVHWAITYLAKVGALERPKRGHMRTTERGRRLLSSAPERITLKTLEQFPELEEFRRKRPDDKPNLAPPTPEFSTAQEPHTTAATPDERIEEAVRELDADLDERLLSRVLDGTPTFFEQLVVDLLVAMGFGGSLGKSQRIGQSGDGGIDGTIDEDALGLDAVYIQAKRYDPASSIGRDRIQQFVGALIGRGASKGVFVTTSSFTRHAKEYAERAPQRIVLIDGGRLTQLMARYGVGVRTERTIEVKKVDLDYFTSDEP